MALDQIAPLVGDIYLLTVLEQTGSFTQTAQRLGISKASVSMRVHALERATGLALVRRTTRQVSLTQAGHALVAEASPAFARIGASLLAVKDMTGTPRGNLRVTAPVALGRQHLAPLLSAFLRKYPEIRIELELVDRLVNMLHEGFDLAIRHTSAPPETCIAWTLCETRSRLVASPTYLRTRGMPTHPHELAAHDCVLYFGDRATDQWTFQRAGDGEPITIAVQGRLRANNSEVLRDAVHAGLGIGLLPDFSLASGGRLVTLFPDWTVQGYFGARLYALRPRSAHVPAAVRLLVDYLRERLAAGFGAG
ncbi:LysR family transcriptional regulator [Verticiella sediminum]|uniref:LysR family transcriptional regulator n=1 Tax=Verticiella sediminum TaxID=1247510 RepID=A0A556AL63_9BURK|nr:LysR family transcriptional regulator [Verticiella sediminum]TSH93621.1 LysR family transcriptional regulator [Verticiella sediminum]